MSEPEQGGEPKQIKIDKQSRQKLVETLRKRQKKLDSSLEKLRDLEQTGRGKKRF